MSGAGTVTPVSGVTHARLIAVADDALRLARAALAGDRDAAGGESG